MKFLNQIKCQIVNFILQVCNVDNVYQLIIFKTHVNKLLLRIVKLQKMLLSAFLVMKDGV